MRWIRILLIVFTVLAVVIGGAALFVFTFDPNDYKPQITALVERLTGRELVLDGRIDLELGAHTSLELTDARFGNPDWATEPYMARLERALLVVNLRSILDGPVIVERFEIEDAELHLEALEDGRNNWTFGDPGAATEADNVTNVIPLVLRYVDARAFRFTLKHPALPRTLDIHAANLQQEQADDGLLDAAATGTLNERTVSIAGGYGPLANLLTATDLNIDANVTLDTLSISAKGLIDDLTWPRRPTFKLHITGPAIDDVTTMFGLPDLGDGGLDLEAAVHTASEGVDATLTGNLGEFEVDLQKRANELLEFDVFSVASTITGPELGNAMNIFGVDGVPGGPFELRGEVKRDNDRLEFDGVMLSIGAATVDLNGTINDFRNLDDSNLELLVKGNDVEKFRELIGVPGAATGPFRIAANLKVRPDGAELLDVLVDTNIAELKIDGSIVGRAPAFVGTQLKFDGTGANLADIAEVYAIPNVLPEPYAVKGAIELGDGQLTTVEDITAKVGEGMLTVAGTIGYAPLERDTNIDVRATGQNLARLVAMAGVTDMVPAVPFDVATGLAIESGGYRLRGLSAKLGENEVELDGVISNRSDLVGTRASFSASGPNLNDLVADSVELEFVEGPFRVSGTAELLEDAVRLQEVSAGISGANLSLNADIGLPIETGSGSFEAAASGPDLAAALPTLPRWQPPPAPFAVSVRGSVADGLWSFDELTATMADARATGSGVFDQPPDLERTRLKVSARIPSLASLGTFDDASLAATRLDFDMLFAGSPDTFRIDPFEARVGDGDISGSLAVELGQEIPDVDLRLMSKYLNVDALVNADPEVAEAIDQESADEPVALPTGDRVIPDTPLPLEQLRRVNARVDIDVADLLYRNLEYRDLQLDVELADGRLVVERANVKDPNGGISATMSLVPTDAGAVFASTFAGTNLYPALGQERTREDFENAPKFDIDLKLDGSGLTYRDLAASLDGKVQISGTGGRIRNSGFSVLFGNFFSELLTSINPFIKKDPYTEISCIVVLLDVNDGIVAVDPGFVAQTDKINIVATGRINLINEKVNVGFKTQPRSRVSISAGEFINPYLQVAGTLGEPKLQLDPTGTIVTGGAAIATAGLSLLATAAWDRVFRADDPCAAAVAESMKDEKKRKKFLGIF